MMSSWSTSRKTNGSGGNYCKGCQDRDRLIDELEDERRRLARMTTVTIHILRVNFDVYSSIVVYYFVSSFLYGIIG
jgi:hypothetical protein